MHSSVGWHSQYTHSTLKVHLCIFVCFTICGIKFLIINFHKSTNNIIFKWLVRPLKSATPTDKIQKPREDAKSCNPWPSTRNWPVSFVLSECPTVYGTCVRKLSYRALIKVRLSWADLDETQQNYAQVSFTEICADWSRDVGSRYRCGLSSLRQTVARNPLVITSYKHAVVWWASPLTMEREEITEKIRIYYR
jgi:hypothetical protein